MCQMLAEKVGSEDNRGGGGERPILFAVGDDDRVSYGGPLLSYCLHTLTSFIITYLCSLRFFVQQRIGV